MANFIETNQRHPGPRALGHTPVVAPDLRESVLEVVDEGVLMEDGIVSFRRRNDPALPVLRNPRR